MHKTRIPESLDWTRLKKKGCKMHFMIHFPEWWETTWEFAWATLSPSRLVPTSNTENVSMSCPSMTPLKVSPETGSKCTSSLTSWKLTDPSIRATLSLSGVACEPSNSKSLKPIPHPSVLWPPILSSIAKVNRSDVRKKRMPWTPLATMMWVDAANNWPWLKKWWSCHWDILAFSRPLELSHPVVFCFMDLRVPVKLWWLGPWLMKLEPFSSLLTDQVR